MTIVREMLPDDDMKAVLTLCRDFFAEYEDHHEEFFDTDNLSDDDISGRFLNSLESDTSATVVALENDVIVGYASVAVHDQPRLYRVKKVGSISALMVAKSHRRQGIATQLLAASKAFFERRGVKYYTLYTSVANQGALALYERVGLTPLHASYLGETDSQQRLASKGR